MSSQIVPCLEFTGGRQLSHINKERFAAYCPWKHPTYTIVKSSVYLSDLSSFYQNFGFDHFKVKKMGLSKKGEERVALGYTHFLIFFRLSRFPITLFSGEK